MLDELIRPADPDHRSCDSRVGQVFHDRAAKPIVENVIFECADYINAARKKLKCAGIHGLDPSRINQGDGNAFSLQKAGCFLC